MKNKFNDDGWLERDGNPNEWAVAFHGVKDTTGYSIPRIVLEGLQILSRGIFCSPKIDIPLKSYTAPTNLNG